MIGELSIKNILHCEELSNIANVYKLKLFDAMYEFTSTTVLAD